MRTRYRMRVSVEVGVDGVTITDAPVDRNRVKRQVSGLFQRRFGPLMADEEFRRELLAALDVGDGRTLELTLTIRNTDIDGS